MECPGCATRHIRFHCASCVHESIATKRSELTRLGKEELPQELCDAFGANSEHSSALTIREKVQSWQDHVDHLSATLEAHRRTTRHLQDSIKEQHRLLQEKKNAARKRRELLEAQQRQDPLEQETARTTSTVQATLQVQQALLRARAERCATIRTLFGFHYTAADQYRLRHFTFTRDWPTFFSDLSPSACSDILGMAAHMAVTLASVLQLTPPLPIVPQGSTSFIQVPKSHTTPERKIPLYVEEDNLDWVCVGVAMLNYNLAFLLSEGLHVTTEWHDVPYTWRLLRRLTMDPAPLASPVSSETTVPLRPRPFLMDFAKILSVVKRAFSASISPPGRPQPPVTRTDIQQRSVSGDWERL